MYISLATLEKGENDKKKMLSEIIVNADTNRKVGKAISEKIYHSLFKKSKKSLTR